MRKQTPRRAEKATSKKRPAHDRRRTDMSFPIVGVGASAGGLEAFTQLLSRLPPDTGMAFVLVQHLDPEHESALTQILSRATSLPVNEVTNNLTVEPDHVYVIPPNRNLSLDAGVLKLEPRPRTRTPHRPIDTFFESLAHDRGESAIGVVLSGTANDGTLGLEAIKAEGGITFAQDATAKYDSMPRSAIAAGCVDLVYAPAEIARELAEIARHPFGAGRSLGLPSRAEEDRAEATEHENDTTPLPSGGVGEPRVDTKRAHAAVRSAKRKGADAKTADRAAEGYKKILLLLRNHSGVDFSLYKSTTIQRRVSRRLVLTKQESLNGYASFLRGNAKELDALYSDVLISVTSFFRNPETFDVLQRNVLPSLLKRRGDEPLRCWVLGCSTGQEAYSIAMAFVEVAEKRARTRQLQIFATDLNEALLDKARHGLYAKSLVTDLSPQRLRRFFVEEAGGYRISKPIRDMVVFARQNLIADPPFSRMDIVSCRNLLIYLEPSLQQKALPTFHYALRPGGFLLLGASESIGTFTGLFEPVDKKHKVYSSKASPTPGFHLRPRSTNTPQAPANAPPFPVRLLARPALPEDMRSDLNAQREADRITVSQFAPPGVLVNAELQILQFRGPTGAYLEPPAGKATFDVLKMAREGLMLPLRAAINQARKENKTAREDNVRIKQHGKVHAVSLEVIPLKNLHERGFLILFKDAKHDARDVRARTAKATRDPPISPRREAKRIADLEAELSETREYLQSMQEQHEAATEELQAANEEVQSANEELQSINEELETSKEELESANEELITINDEMSNRNVELGRLNNDLVNLQTSTRLAVLVVGRDLTVRRFSPEAEKQFDLQAADLGRPISILRHNLVVVAKDGAETLLDLEALSAEVVASVRELEQEVRSKGGRWYSLRMRPYMTVDGKVDGAVLVLLDVDTLKRAEHVVADARDYAENVITTLREPLLVLDHDLRVETANRAFYRTFRVAPLETVGRLVYELGDGEWNIPRLRQLLGEVLTQNISIEDFDVDHTFEHIGPRSMLLNARRISDSQRKTERILLAFQDVTERKHGDERLRQNAADLSEANRRKTEFLAMLAHELRNPLAPIANAVQIIRKADGNARVIDSVTSIIERQVDHMVKLVDDLLDVNRIGQGKIELRRERVDLATVVRDAVETVRPLAERREHDLKVSLPTESIVVNADPLRLAQVLVNLLNNACKFTTKGGLIQLNVEPKDDSVLIRICDNGMGISAEQIPRIFEMFMQVNSSLERTAQGLGIGLTLVKTLVEMHGGKVEARSAGEGFGSEFVVSLPVVAEALPSAETKIGPTTASAVRRVLIVDDNDDAARSLAMLLSMEGIETLTAHDGIEALEVAPTFKPELVLLDIGMPRLNGYEVARRMRQEPWGKSVVLLALTGWGKAADREKSRSAGFDGHLVKPLDSGVLMRLLAEFPSLASIR